MKPALAMPTMAGLLLPHPLCDMVEYTSLSAFSQLYVMRFVST